MHPAKHGVNSITVGATELLLTATAGSAVHLTPTAAPDVVGEPAVPDHCFTEAAADLGRPGLANYDVDLVRAPRWSPTTLCGRTWIEMVGGDGGSINVWGGEAEFAPTCKRCLALLDRMFPTPAAHPRLPLIVRVLGDTVAEHGYAELHGVPGDQQTELRRQIRTTVRKQTGHPCQTMVADSLVVVVCEPIAELYREQGLREAAQRMDDLLFGGKPLADIPDPDWRHYWSTWAID